MFIFLLQFEHYKVSPGYTITDIEEYHDPIAAAAAEVVEKAVSEICSYMNYNELYGNFQLCW